MKTMNMNAIVLGTLTLSIILILSGCATTGYVWYSDPRTQQVDNQYFSAEISPISTTWGCEAFCLSIRNKSHKNLELNWNKTLYIVNGQTSGSFMFEGVVYKDRNNPKPPDVIFPRATLIKAIWPNNLVYFQVADMVAGDTDPAYWRKWSVFDNNS